MGSKRRNGSVSSDRATKKQQKQPKQPKQQEDRNAASTTEDAKLLCPIGCGLKRGDDRSPNHPCWKATKSFKNIAKLNEHLKRVHSGQYTCPVCRTPFSIVSKAALEVLQRDHVSKCNANTVHSLGRRPGQANGAVPMTPEQRGRWANWRDQTVSSIDGESTTRTSWRKIWKCLWPDDQPPEIMCEYDEALQAATAIPKEEEILDLDRALAQPPVNSPQLVRPHMVDSILVDCWGHPNTPNSSMMNASPLQFSTGFPGQGGNNIMGATSDIISRSDNGGYLVPPPGLLPGQHPQHHPISTYSYSCRPPSMIFSDGSHEFGPRTMHDEHTGLDPQYLHAPSQASGGGGLHDFCDAGISDEPIEPTKEDQNNALLSSGAWMQGQDEAGY